MKVLCCRKGGAARHANASTPVSCRCAVSRRRRPGSVQAPGPPTPHGPTGSAWSPPHTRHSSRRCRRRSGAERFDLCLSHHFARLDESRALRETSRLFKPDGASARKTPLAPPGLVRYHRPHWAPRGTAGHRQSPPGTTGLTSSHQASSGVTKPPSPRQAAPGPITPHQVPLGPTGPRQVPPERTGPRRVPPEPTGQAA